MKTRTIIIPDPTKPSTMRETRPEASNAGGVVRGLERASAMSGKDLTGKGKPAVTGTAKADTASGGLLNEAMNKRRF